MTRRCTTKLSGTVPIFLSLRGKMGLSPSPPTVLTLPLVSLAIVLAGCATLPKPSATSATHPASASASAAHASNKSTTVQRLPAPEAAPAAAPVAAAVCEQPVSGEREQSIALATHTQQLVIPNSAEEIPATPDESLARDGLLDVDGVLDVDRLVDEVLAQNPSVEAMIATWQAAAARYPQAIALDDPMFDGSIGPDSFGQPDLKPSYMVMASQKFFWPGKRRLRGSIAGAEASAAASEIDDVRLQLAEAARLAFVDYFAAYRNLTFNADNVREIREYRETAISKYRASTASQQDVLQSDVELALLGERQNQLEREISVATARINTLLHREANEPLPPPPATLLTTDRVPSPEELRETAIRERPDLAALSAEIRASQAALALACKEFYPDPELYFKYDAFWQEAPLRPAVGMKINVPLYREKRWAAVREARAKLQSRRAEFERLLDDVANEIYAAHARLVESQRTATLYDQKIVPAAEKNVESARAGYASGNVDFLRLIDARRQLIALHEQQVEALSNYHRAAAELARTVGTPRGN
jgi:outer membrane protein, heavy metal efflux system